MECFLALQQLLLIFNDLLMNITFSWNFFLARNTVQLGMHIKTGEIYLADGLYWWSRAGGINKIKPDGSGYTSVIDSGIGSGGITGVAVDWMAGKPLWKKPFWIWIIWFPWNFLQKLYLLDFIDTKCLVCTFCSSYVFCTLQRIYTSQMLSRKTLMLRFPGWTHRTDLSSMSQKTKSLRLLLSTQLNGKYKPCSERIW